ncbi:MAG: hypothetical protein WC876_00915 [Candidatus Thermoplasmatota archaeon]|jgi:hypothetical protein
MAFPEFGWETTNPLAYFNLGGFILSILILVKLRDRRGESNLLAGAWWATLIVCVGTGLHFLGDLTGVSEELDHQFIHFVLLAALLVLFLFARRDD